jgi:hypothetical protein
MPSTTNYKYLFLVEAPYTVMHQHTPQIIHAENLQKRLTCINTNPLILIPYYIEMNRKMNIIDNG